MAPDDTTPRAATVRAHPNIALVKYWGKRPGPGNVPAVGSVSVTLDTLATVTRVAPAADGAPTDAMTGLGAAAHQRMAVFVSMMRDRALAAGCRSAQAPLQIDTHNNFPTAAGLASSASGFAALTLALATAWQWPLSLPAMSALARQGSGSAARSLFGGFVRISSGRQTNTEAVAEGVLAAADWPLHVLVAVVDSSPKVTSSTDGMRHTQATSAYWSAWVDSHAADESDAIAAIEARDFARLANVTERSCLKMHASMLAAAPGLLYWLPATVALMHEVRALRAQGVPACFTIDAGPQVKVVCSPDAHARVAQALHAVPGVQRVLACGLGPGAHVVPPSG